MAAALGGVGASDSDANSSSGGGAMYMWVPNAYLLAQVAVLPLYGQASNIFGRRSLLLLSVALFTLGSGLSGGARSVAMLVGARAVQGLGGGGINLLIETIVTDIVPLRQRGKYMGIVGLGATVGATLGPFLGGLIASHDWRWCFYLNVPIGGVAFLALFFFLRVNYQRDQTWAQRLRRVDFGGNAIFMAAIVAVLLALTWGGAVFAWDTVHVLLPLVLGLAGLAVFTAFEWTPRLCPEPSFPRQLVRNRTSAVALALTFLHAVVVYWAYYFLPLYFQAVRGASPLRSGIDTLPTFAGGLVFAVAGGLLLSRFGRYRPLHLFAFATMALSFGLFARFLHDGTAANTATWAGLQILNAVGAGGAAGLLLPAVQAPLDERLVGTATGVWSFVRYFGCVWGVTIPSVVFNNVCAHSAAAARLAAVDADLAAALSGNRAYQHATAAFLDSIADPQRRSLVVAVFADALRICWLVGLAFAALAVVLVFFEKEVKLREELNTEFGIDDSNAVVVAATAAALEEHGVLSEAEQGRRPVEEKQCENAKELSA